jgi:DNA-binding FadR family transcriptional regulator
VFDELSPRGSIVDACAAAIERSIISGELAIGSRLPAERRLAESFRINRVSVRSALAKLAAAGLLRVRQGSGYVVQDYRKRGGPDLLTGVVSWAREQGDIATVVADLLLVRRQLARAVLERLSEKDRLDVAPIRQAVDAFAAAVAAGADSETLAAADLDVVGAITAATGSAVLQLCHNPVIAVVAELPQLCDALYTERERNVEAHQVFLLWLAKRPVAHIDQLVGAMRQRDEATVYALRRSTRAASRRVS